MKKSYIVLIALDVIVVAALGAATVFLHSRVERLSNTISYIQDNTDILVTDMSNLQSNIKATLEEEASKVEEWSVDVIDTDFDAKTYTVHVSVVPKEYTASTTVSVYFGANEYPLTLDGIKFVGDVVLPLNESYKGNLTFLFVDGDSRATEVRTDYEGIQEEFSGVVNGKMVTAPTITDGKLSFSTSNDINLNAGKYGIQSFDLIVERSGYDGGDNQDEAATAVEDDKASEDKKDEKTDEINIEECERIDLINALSIDRKSILDSGSQMTLAGEVELKKAFDISPNCSIRVYLSVETSEGFTFEYDLYNGTIDDTGTAIIDEIAKEPADKNHTGKDQGEDEASDSSDSDEIEDSKENDEEASGNAESDNADENPDSDNDKDLENEIANDDEVTDEDDTEMIMVDHFAPNAKVYDAKGSVYYLE